MSPTHDRPASRRLALVAVLIAPLCAAACAAEAPEPTRTGSYNTGIVSRADVERAMAMHRPPAPPVPPPVPEVTKAPAPPPVAPKPQQRPRVRAAAAPVAAPEVTKPVSEPAPMTTSIATEEPLVLPPSIVPPPAAATPAVAASAVADLDESSRIYSKEDPDVLPAQLLTGPGSAGFSAALTDINTMELVISKLGRVEEVRLSAPPKRMTDMLLLSGAKMWKFVPAMKNGQPVRYRTQVSWETTR